MSAVEIYKKISAYIPKVELEPGKTLIFLDEIQRCSAAGTALKFLSEDMKYDVIASGSLLGLSYDRDNDADSAEIESVRVGYEEQLTMYSLDLEEFLRGIGYNENTIDVLKSYFDKQEKIPNGINERFLSLVWEYMVVGGMPEVVADFADKHDFNSVDIIQNRIVADYKDNIVTRAKNVEKVKIKNIMNQFLLNWQEKIRNLNILHWSLKQHHENTATVWIGSAAPIWRIFVITYRNRNCPYALMK